MFWSWMNAGFFFLLKKRTATNWSGSELTSFTQNLPSIWTNTLIINENPTEKWIIWTIKKNHIVDGVKVKAGGPGTFYSSLK